MRHRKAHAKSLRLSKVWAKSHTFINMANVSNTSTAFLKTTTIALQNVHPVVENNTKNVSFSKLATQHDVVVYKMNQNVVKLIMASVFSIIIASFTFVLFLALRWYLVYLFCCDNSKKSSFV